MKFIILFIYFYLSFSNALNKCCDCIYFISTTSPQNGMCSTFGKYKINNEILFEYAEHCRKNEYQCGKTGYFFEKKHIFYYEKKNKFFIK